MTKQFFLSLLLWAAVSPTHAGISVGQEPFDNLGKDQTGERVQISQHRGKLVIVSFFATWCGPCRKELPILAEIQKRAGRDKVVVVIVNYKEERRVYSQVVKLFADYDLVVTHDRDGRISSKFDVDALPRLVIVGKDGKVAAQHRGYNESSLPKLVDEINRLWNVAPN
ncbi:MAG TPA: TlpA disulfide reductase family protein [Steroidobacteraceae bacterium]|nr:TlpA disulfide reductase family protein [Steroidobacteraceae bacterium]